MHGLKHYPLRAEIVILSSHAVIVIGSTYSGLSVRVRILSTSKVKSVLRLQDFLDVGLRIENKEKAPKASLEGRRICTDNTKSPGLPLFQPQSFNSQGGEGVICDSIELKFSSREARGISYA